MAASFLQKLEDKNLLGNAQLQSPKGVPSEATAGLIPVGGGGMNNGRMLELGEEYIYIYR